MQRSLFIFRFCIYMRMTNKLEKYEIICSTAREKVNTMPLTRNIMQDKQD